MTYHIKSIINTENDVNKKEYLEWARERIRIVITKTILHEVVCMWDC
jgi:hypothetical protein